jgi:Protein of unknown function (DUF4238)
MIPRCRRTAAAGRPRIQPPDSNRRTRGYGWIVSYQVKPRSHVVPAGYLRAWTHGAEIAMRLGVSEESVTTSIRNVGVRSNFYRRERPKTGETIHDVEWSIEQLETAALPVISSLPSRWPLGAEDKARVAQFFGLQVVRGPAFEGLARAVRPADHRRCSERSRRDDRSGAG